MSLDTSKTILKVAGIISIIFGVLGIIMGVMAIAGSALVGAGTAAGEIATSNEMAGGIALLGFGGLVILISAVIELISGVCSVKASNDISKIMPAWIFAIISLITHVCTVIFSIKDNSSIVGAVIGLLISGLIFVAANNIKKAAGK